MTTSRLMMAALAAGFAATSASAGVLGTYELAGGSLAVTDANAGDGITMSDITVGAGLGNLFDNGGSGDAFRFSGDDTENGTAAALTATAYLSFTVTNNSGAAISLESVSMDYQATNAFGYSSARLFSDVQGFDDVTGDTIGSFGRTSAGSDGAVVNDVIDLVGGGEFGSNVNAADFTIADGGSIIFYVPWIDDSGSDTRFTDVDNISVSIVPEPGSLALLGIGGLLIARRRRA